MSPTPTSSLPGHTVPEELVEVPMLHILEDHDERVTLYTDTIELDNVFVLEVGQQLSLSVKVLACVVTSILQRLEMRNRGERKPTHLKLKLSKKSLQQEGITSLGPRFLDGKKIHLIYYMKYWENDLNPEEIIFVLITEEKSLVGMQNFTLTLQFMKHLHTYYLIKL